MAVGDAVDGMRMARAAGTGATGFSRGVATADQLTAAQAESVVGTFHRAPRMPSGSRADTA